jgi:hypothetical protein
LSIWWSVVAALALWMEAAVLVAMQLVLLLFKQDRLGQLLLVLVLGVVLWRDQTLHSTA